MLRKCGYLHEGLPSVVASESRGVRHQLTAYSQHLVICMCHGASGIRGTLDEISLAKSVFEEGLLDGIS